jgi:predicted deacylase
MNKSPSYGSVQPHVAEDLEIDELPKGRKTRLLLELAHDAIGRPLRLPVLVARGERPGPVFGVTAAIHGNELNGIPVIHRLFEHLDPHTLRGSVVAVVVANVPGYLMHQRTFNEGTDLNDIMPGRPEGNAAEIFAHRLIQRAVRHFNYLVDLHTAKFGNMNSLYVRADMTHPVAARMAYLQRSQIILHNPPSDGTLRGAAMALGIPAITLEIGNPLRFQSKYIRTSLIGLRRVLSDVGMISRRPVAPGEPPILCERSYWMRTDHGGLLEVFPGVTEQVEEGQVVGRLSTIFGDVLREYRAPESGVVIGKRVNPAGQTGSRILHLGIIAEAGSHPFRNRKAVRG